MQTCSIARVPGGRRADEHEAARGGMVAMDAGGHLEEQALALDQGPVLPGGVLLAEALGRADERAEPRGAAAGQDHRAVRLGRDLALVDARLRGIDRGLHHRVGDRRRLARVRNLARRLDQSQLVDQARGIDPDSLRRAAKQRLVDPRREEQAVLLHADTPVGEALVPQDAAGDPRRVLVVGIADEAGAGDLIRDRDPLHRPRDQGHPARGGDDQEMQREEALMVETGQIEDVLGGGDHEAGEVVGRHRGADALKAGIELLAREHR